MIANCSEMIAYFNGKPRSGTASTVRKAREAGLDVLNIFDELQGYFTINCSAKRYLQDFPNVTSFRYGREGVLFEEDSQPLPVAFEQIAKIAREGDNLHFFLGNDLNYFASLTSDDARVSFTRFRGDC